MKTATSFVVAILVVAVSPTYSGERPTAEELLTAYENSVEQLTRARIQCVEKIPERRIGENESRSETHERTIVRDGSRWKVADASSEIRTLSGAKRELNRRTEIIVGEQIINVSRSPNGSMEVAACLDPTTIEKRQIGTQYVTRSHWNVLGTAEALFGRFPGDDNQPLWLLMREASALTLLPDMEEIDGVPTYVLKSVGKFGEHTVWIDPARGGLPRRIYVRKQSGNLYGDVQLGSRSGVADEPPPQPGRKLPSTQPRDYREFSARIDNIQIEKKDGVFLMTAWKSDEKITFGSGKIGGRQSEHSVTAVDFKPESWAKNAFRLDIVIPDKTRVDVRDGLTGAVYEWVGGTIQLRGGN
jgi:hypothetical protein